jgi:DNA repair exonuclease SbcCD ATPase subunit
MRLSDSQELKNKRVQDAISTTVRLTRHKTKLNRLSKKRDELEDLMPKLSAAIKTAEREKDLVIDNYCNDKCKSEDLETAKKSYDEAANAEKRNLKLLNTLNSKIKNLNDRLNDLRENKLKTEQLVWESLSDEINEDLKKKLGDMILWAYTVNRQRPIPLLYNDFLQLIVFPKPKTEDLKRIDSDLEALYQKTLKGLKETVT